MVAKEIFEMQSSLCQAMGNAVRLEIVHNLRDKSENASALAQITGLKPATLSRHLAALRNIGLITAERQGQENVYHLANPKIAVICDLMREVLAEQISRQAEAANQNQ